MENKLANFLVSLKKARGEIPPHQGRTQKILKGRVLKKNLIPHSGVDPAIQKISVRRG